jgi:hypothetical protein
VDASPWELLLWGFILLAGVALAWHVATDDGNPESKREQALQRRLARYPASARAVVVRRHPTSAGWWRPLLNAAVVIGVVYGLSYVLEHGLIFLCGRVGMVETLRWTRLFFFPGVPILAMLPALWMVSRSIRILRGGYAPPLDSKPAQDTIAVAGWRARIRGIGGLALIVAAVSFIGDLAYDARQAFEAPEKTARIRAECPTRYSSEAGFSR